MTDHTAINWVQYLATAQGKDARIWNPIRGCSPESKGCRNCWAARVADMRGRQSGKVGELYRGLTGITCLGRHVFNGSMRIVEHHMDAPLRWRKPAVIFAGSETDLFHQNVPTEWLNKIFLVMEFCPHHTFLILTKRPKRMIEYASVRMGRGGVIKWPLSNVWLGVSIEDQTTAEERIPHLLTIPAEKRFVSAEPLLGEIDLASLDYHDHDGGKGSLNSLRGEAWIKGFQDPDVTPSLDWVIAGGESGPNARPMHPDWARSLRDQCQAAGVPFYFKQWGEWFPHRAAGIYKNVRRLNFSYGDECLLRVGKKSAGRMLDGREWNEMPR